MKAFLYPAFRALSRSLYVFLYRPDIKGQENIPTSGPVIIAANHIAKIDVCPGVISCNRPIRFLAKDTFMEKPVLHLLFNGVGCIKVNSSGKSPEAIRTAEETLKKGAVVGIFPEGKRNKASSVLLPFRYGAVRFARDTGAPIVPCGISGAYRLFGNSLRVRYGQPLYVSEEEDLTEANERLKKEIEALRGGGEPR